MRILFQIAKQQTGLTMDDIAAICNTSRTTLYRWSVGMPIEKSTEVSIVYWALENADITRVDAWVLLEQTLQNMGLTQAQIDEVTTIVSGYIEK